MIGNLIGYKELVERGKELVQTLHSCYENGLTQSAEITTQQYLEVCYLVTRFLGEDLRKFQRETGYEIEE